MARHGSEARQRVLEARAKMLEQRRLRKVVRTAPSPAAAAVSVPLGGDDRRTLRILAVCGVVLLILYSKTLLALQNIWEIDPNYSHGYLIPLVVGFFAWRAWSSHGLPQRDEVSTAEIAIGLCEIGLGFFLHVVAWFNFSPLLDVFALVGILHGLLMVLGGQQGSRPYGVAVLYLLFMAPLPVAVYQPMAIFMQDLVSEASMRVLNICQVPAIREGYVISVQGHQMEVGEACSGLRQLTAFLALSVAASHLSERRRWYKLALVALAIPTAVAANTARVALTGVIMMLLGEEMATGVWHTMEGLAVFVVGIGFFLGFAWLLSLLDDGALGGGKAAEPEGQPAVPAAAAEPVVAEEPPAAAPAWRQRLVRSNGSDTVVPAATDAQPDEAVSTAG